MSKVAVLKGGRSLERGVSLRSAERVEDALDRLGHEVHGIDAGHDLVARLRDLAPDAARVILERHVQGHDLAVSILDGEPLPVVEAVPNEEDFYDFEARYEIGRTTFVCPADLGAELTQRTEELAVAAHEALGCTGFS